MLSLLHDSIEFNYVCVQPLYLDKNSTPLDQPTALAIGALLDHPPFLRVDLTTGPEARLNQIKTERRTRHSFSNGGALPRRALYPFFCRL